MKVLVTGVAGRLGRVLARRLLAEGHTVLGIDRRPWPDPPRGLEMFPVDIRKRPAEDVFRKHHPEAVVHMATVTHFQRSGEERYRINLNGTRAVFDHAAKYGVGHVLFVGRHTYYGAAADAPLYHTEADPPLAVATFPDLADLVAADLYAGAALWRHPEMCTTVLRFVYTLEGALPYLNVVKISPTEDPRRRLMGTSFCTRVKEAVEVGSDLVAALGDDVGGRAVRSAGFSLDDQAHVDFVLGDGDATVTGRLRVTVYG